MHKVIFKFLNLNKIIHYLRPYYEYDHYFDNATRTFKKCVDKFEHCSYCSRTDYYGIFC